MVCRQLQRQPGQADPGSDAGGDHGAGRGAIGRPANGGTDPSAALSPRDVQPRLRDGVPKAREINVTACTGRHGEFAAPGTRRRRCEERACQEPLQATVATLKAEIRAAGGHRAGGPVPAQGGRDRGGAGREEPVVAHRRDADVDGAGDLGGRRGHADKQSRRGDARAPGASRARGESRSDVRGDRGAARGPAHSPARPRWPRRRRRPRRQPFRAARRARCRARRRAGTPRGRRLQPSRRG